VAAAVSASSSVPAVVPSRPTLEMMWTVIAARRAVGARRQVVVVCGMP
jgi:hypothetical protein